MSRARSHWSRTLGILELLAAIGLVGLSAASTPAAVYGDIEVDVEPQPAAGATTYAMLNGGYIEHRVIVRNWSKTLDHTVRLRQIAQAPVYFQDYLAQNSRTVQVSAGSTSVVSLFQPTLPTADELTVDIDGERQDEKTDAPSPFGSGYGTFGFSTGAHPLLVLASRGIPQELKDTIRAEHGNAVVFYRSETALGGWTTHWLGYTAYDVVFMTRDEAAEAPPAVLLALRRYVEAGGVLLLHGPSLEAEQLVPETLRDPGHTADDEGAFHIGFGLVRACPEAAPWPPEFWRHESHSEVAPADRAVQIVSEITVPVRGLLLLVICYAVGIGPVNVWLLSRRQQRMWLWWNVPAVSFATCLTVFSYSMFSEGVRGHGRMALITLLDENAHRATTVGYASYYCPLTPSDGLRFSYDTAVAQLRSEPILEPWRHRGRPKSIDWTNDQHLDSGWVLARVPACFALRKSETRRERLSFHKSAEGVVSVVNGLGVEIDALAYLEENGTFRYATEIPAGAERSLEARPPKVSPVNTRSLRAIFNQPWNVSQRALKDTPEEFLKPGCYVAVVKQNPFMEDPLVAASQDGSSAVIYGIGAKSSDGR